MRILYYFFLSYLINDAIILFSAKKTFISTMHYKYINPCLCFKSMTEQQFLWSSYINNEKKFFGFFLQLLKRIPLNNSTNILPKETINEKAIWLSKELLHPCKWRSDERLQWVSRRFSIFFITAQNINLSFIPIICNIISYAGQFIIKITVVYTTFFLWKKTPVYNAWEKVKGRKKKTRRKTNITSFPTPA